MGRLLMSGVGCSSKMRVDSDIGFGDCQGGAPASINPSSFDDLPPFTSKSKEA